MNKLVDHICSEMGIKNRTLLEKDTILQTLLYEISNIEYLRENLVFKGGTCLTKCYLGHYRFSEDIILAGLINQSLKIKVRKKFEDCYL